MARTNATNYTGPLQFPYGTAGTDLFKKEDVQVLAQAVDQHDHSVGKGLVLGPGSVTGAMIASETITGANVLNGSLTGQDMQDNSVSGVKLADASVAGSKLIGNTITGDKIAATTIVGGNIAANTLTGGHILDGSIQGADLAAGAALANLAVDSINNFKYVALAGGSTSSTTLVDCPGGSITAAFTSAHYMVLLVANYYMTTGVGGAIFGIQFDATQYYIGRDDPANGSPHQVVCLFPVVGNGNGGTHTIKAQFCCVTTGQTCNLWPTAGSGIVGYMMVLDTLR